MAGLVLNSSSVFQLKFSAKLKFCASKSATSPSCKPLSAMLKKRTIKIKLKILKNNPNMKKLCILLFIIFNYFLSFSQITYTKYETKQEELISMSEPYDSLQNLNISSVKSENKKFIGQKIYLPKNEINENIKMDRREFTEPFLFTKYKKTYFLDTISTTTELYKLHSKSFYNPKKFKYTEEQRGKFIDSITTNIYMPFLYCDMCGDNKMQLKNSNKVQDKYYKIVNIIYGNELKSLNLSTKWFAVDDLKYDNNLSKDINSVKYFSDIREIKYKYDIAFELLDESTNEIFYYSQRNLNSNNAKFILVSFFEKQKKMFKEENLISEGSSERDDLIKTVKIEDENGKIILKPKKVEYGYNHDKIWKCIDVTILEGNKEISYILQNKNNETIALDYETIKSWEFEKDILAKEKLRNENDLKIKQEKEKEFQTAKLKEKLNSENRKRECISKFGAELGEIIAQHKLKIGMTKEMCKMSWGTPIWSDKTTISKGTTENWYYGFVHSLYFEGNILVRIEE
jgi:hypothetical protein